MKTRVLSGLIMLPLLIIIILRGWVLFAGCFALSLLAVYEFFRGFKELNIKPSYPIAVGSTVLLYVMGMLCFIGTPFSTSMFSTQFVFMLECSLEILIILDETGRFERDMYYAQGTELFEQAVVVTMKYQEGIFLHLCNHTAAPFLSACSAIRASASRLPFTIFWLDFERFSSSSMNRLILRIAS